MTIDEVIEYAAGLATSRCTVGEWPATSAASVAYHPSVAPTRPADLSQLHVIVPVRALDDGKKRLSPVLDEQQRALLVAGLLEPRSTSSGRGRAAAIHVVSPDPAVMPLARSGGARPILQADEGLNEASSRREIAVSGVPRPS
jgi:hypothetical protein